MLKTKAQLLLLVPVQLLLSYCFQQEKALLLSM